MSYYALKVKGLFFLIAVAAALLLFSFSSETSSVTRNNFIGKYTAELNEAIITLDNAANDFQFGRISADSLQHTLINTRISYKKIEFFLAFHYNEYVNEHINGAPLLHIEQSNTKAVVLPPEGLQVLDEMIFSETVQEEKVQIASLAKKLKSNYEILFLSLNKKEPAHSSEIVAIRLQMVRIFTLGITGFDTPGSVNALPEAAAALESMKIFFKESHQATDDKKNQVLSLFDKAIADLNNSTFEKLDRLHFLISCINPLYEKLGQFQLGSDSEFLANMTPWNSSSTSIFSSDFLNPYFFTELKKEEDSEGLKSLGKMLFYDPILSNDQKMSCATCHQPNKGFADAIPKSLSSIQGKTVLRNAPTLINAVYADRYFYDLRAFSLEQQAEHVFFSPDEFNTAYSAILKKLNGNEQYAKKFKAVFGKNEITREKFSKALASYVLSLNSFNSPFDKYVRGEVNYIEPDVKNGFNLFMGKANCATCHFAPTFSGLVPPFYTDSESEILGVLENPNARTVKLDNDKGRLDNTILSEQAWIFERSFKTTTVRNADLTAPYFHNGAYQTLDEVMEFYNKGGGEGLGLSVQNQTLSPDPLDLTEKEKKDLIAFIKSLNDTSVAY